MTASSSPSPAPVASSDAPSPASLQELRALRRQLRIFALVLLLPGSIVFVIGLWAAALPAIFRAPSPDPFPYLSPLARVGWGLVALGMLLLVPVGRILRRRNPRLHAQEWALVQQRYRHPRLVSSVAIWANLVFVTLFAALALMPREVMIHWLTPADPGIDADWYAIGILFVAQLASIIVALVPLLALRLFDRPR